MNLILATDSYKIGHWDQYPKDTETVYSYFESREGATYPYTVFFGLQAILKEYFQGQVVSYEDIEEADKITKAHFGRDLFNKEGWEYIVREKRGRLPLRIKAVPEGTPVPTGNVLMTVENTDPECWWLTNQMESLLTHVWYPSTVATLSRHTKEMMAAELEGTSDNGIAGLPFMLHDFGYRGASSHESAAIGGAGHLVNFKGTDTLPAMQLALDQYDADLDNLAFSVPATEHSVMTSLGREGEYDQVARVLSQNPTGILSVVADSYNIYKFVEAVCSTFKSTIERRDGVFVVRPDSVTQLHPKPADLVLWIIQQLWDTFGGEENSKNYKVLNPKVRILWGDGLDPKQIEKVLNLLKLNKFSAENMVFGMGGGLLQKNIDRDTQRFAFKCSAQERNRKWVDIFKDPVDSTKKSKKGRLRLSLDEQGNVATEPHNETVHDHIVEENLLREVFSNGDLWDTQNFEEVRKNAALKVEARCSA